MFDAIAPRYDFLNHLLSAGIDRLLAGAGDSVARPDGTRARPRSLHRHGGPRHRGAHRAAGGGARGRRGLCRRHAADRPPASCAGAGLTGEIALVRGDATQIPAADASVDAVTIAFGIRNVEDVHGPRARRCDAC